MSIAEEGLDQALPMLNPQWLSAAIHKHGVAALDEEHSEDGEDFDFQEAEDFLSSDADNTAVKPLQECKVSAERPGKSACQSKEHYHF